MSTLVSRYPSDVPEEDLVALLTALQNLQAECRKTESIVWVMSALEVRGCKKDRRPVFQNRQIISQIIECDGRVSEAGCSNSLDQVRKASICLHVGSDRFLRG